MPVALFFLFMVEMFGLLYIERTSSLTKQTNNTGVHFVKIFYTFLDCVLLSNIFYSVNPQIVIIFSSHSGRDIK